MPQPGKVYLHGKKRVEGKYGETQTQAGQFAAEQRTEDDLFRTSKNSEQRGEGSSYNNFNNVEQRLTEGSCPFSCSNGDGRRKVAGLFRASNNSERRTQGDSCNHFNTIEQRTEDSSFRAPNNSEQKSEGCSYKQSNNIARRPTEDSSLDSSVAGLFRISNNSEQRGEGSSSLNHSNNASQRTDCSSFSCFIGGEQRTEDGLLRTSSNSNRRSERSSYNRSNAEQRTEGGSFNSSFSGTDDSCYTKLDFSGDHVTKTSERETNHGWDEQNMRQPQGLGTYQPRYSPAVTGERVMLKGRLCNGRISHQPGDIEILHFGFKVPDLIKDFLLGKHGSISKAEVEIVSVNDDENQLSCSVDSQSKENPEDKGSQIASNEILKLETRFQYGKVSFEKDVVEFITLPDLEISQYLIGCLEES